MKHRQDGLWCELGKENIKGIDTPNLLACMFFVRLVRLLVVVSGKSCRPAGSRKILNRAAIVIPMEEVLNRGPAANTGGYCSNGTEDEKMRWSCHSRCCVTLFVLHRFLSEFGAFPIWLQFPAGFFLYVSHSVAVVERGVTRAMRRNLRAIDIYQGAGLLARPAEVLGSEVGHRRERPLKANMIEEVL